MECLDITLNKMVDYIVKRSKLEGTPTERMQIHFYFIQYSLWLFVPLASLAIIYMVIYIFKELMNK